MVMNSVTLLQKKEAIVFNPRINQFRGFLPAYSSIYSSWHNKCESNQRQEVNEITRLNFEITPRRVTEIP